MKKIININIQGRVIPIEETAYVLLQQYMDSLRAYFADEEGSEEIINDIEGRIAELFAERLKLGAACITDADIEAVAASMGRPEDFDPEDKGAPQPSSAKSQAGPRPAPPGQGERRVLYRNADDRVLGGVASGLANYVGIDPVITRIVFVLLSGVLFWVYILLWIVVPARSVQSNITKRLYRSPDQKMLGGVAGGLAAYFNIPVWVPRLIFLFPLITVVLSAGFEPFWWNGLGFIPRMASGSFSVSLFVAYIILWISVPLANTAPRRLEMRGEKIDLSSIASTVKEDLQQVRLRAEKFGSEVGSRAKQGGQEVFERMKAGSAETGTIIRKTSLGLAGAIVALIKAVLIFALAIAAIALFGIFIALIFGGVAFAPLNEFILEGSWQPILAWLTLFLVFMLPMVGLITWAVRRIIGVRNKRHYLAPVFTGLWLLGLVCGMVLLVMITRNFRKSVILEEEELVLMQPEEKLFVNMEENNWRQYAGRQPVFFGEEIWSSWPVYSKGEDSVSLNTVKIDLVKSKDSSFHIYCMKASRGYSDAIATRNARELVFDLQQPNDSTIVFPRGFFIDRKHKFRNQRIWIVIEVPAQKNIVFDKRLEGYHWFELRNDDRYRNLREDWRDDWMRLYRARPGKEYHMQENGKPQLVEAPENESVNSDQNN